jgi:hypothetical protein
MSDFAHVPVDQVQAAADYVVDALGNDPDAVVMIPVPNGISARERRDLIDHHQDVIEALRGRGWLDVRAIVRHTPTGSALGIDLRPSDPA